MKRTPVYDGDDPLETPLTKFLAGESADSTPEVDLPEIVDDVPEQEPEVSPPPLSEDLRNYIANGGQDIESFYRQKFSQQFGQPNQQPIQEQQPLQPKVDPIETEAKEIAAQLKQIKQLQRQGAREGLDDATLEQLDEQEAQLNARIAELKTEQIFASKFQVAQVRQTLPQTFKSEVQQLVAARGFQGDVGDVYSILPDQIKTDDVIMSFERHPEWRRFFVEALAWRTVTQKAAPKKAPSQQQFQQNTGQPQRQQRQAEPEITLDFLMGRSKK